MGPAAAAPLVAAAAPTVAGASALYPAAAPLAGASMMLNPGTAAATAGGLSSLYPTAGALAGASQMMNAAPALGAVTPAAMGGASPPGGVMSGLRGMLSKLTPEAAMALGPMASQLGGGDQQQPPIQAPPARPMRMMPTQMQASFANRIPPYRRF